MKWRHGSGPDLRLASFQSEVAIGTRKGLVSTETGAQIDT